jgi:hypothetical protein
MTPQRVAFNQLSKEQALAIAYNVVRSNRKTGDEGPQPRKSHLKLIRDENGDIIKVPKRRPRQYQKTLDRWSEAPCREGEPAYWGGVTREDLDRMQWLLDPKGHVMCPKINLKWGYNDQDAARAFWMGVMEQLPRAPRRRLFLRRNGTLNRKPWKAARGNASSRERQAAYYLKGFDHENAWLFDEDEFSLLKVVCNLRRYFGMGKEQTIKLMTSLFNPKARTCWSPEGIALAWDLVEEYAPGLGLNDPVAITEKSRLELEDDITDLLAYTREGGRVPTTDFYNELKKWNPDLKVTKTAVTQAVKRITGKETKPFRKGRCYPEFHLPTAQELEDSNHLAGIDPREIEDLHTWAMKRRRPEVSRLREDRFDGCYWLPWSSLMKRQVLQQVERSTRERVMAHSSYRFLSHPARAA